jgi:hypothetical protein
VSITSKSATFSEPNRTWLGTRNMSPNSVHERFLLLDSPLATRTFWLVEILMLTSFVVYSRDPWAVWWRWRVISSMILYYAPSLYLPHKYLFLSRPSILWVCGVVALRSTVGESWTSLNFYLSTYSLHFQIIAAGDFLNYIWFLFKIFIQICKIISCVYIFY